MKKISFILMLCLLMTAVSVPVFAVEAPATEEWPFEPDIDYKAGEVLVNTLYVVDLSQYEGEGPFDFHGIAVTSIEDIYQDIIDSQSHFDRFGYCTYKLTLDSSVSVKEAIEVLNAVPEIEEAYINYLVYIPEDCPPNWQKGDIQRDGSVDTFDCLAIKSHYFGKTVLKDLPLQRADVNKDGVVDIFDYMEVKTICFE